MAKKILSGTFIYVSKKQTKHERVADTLWHKPTEHVCNTASFDRVTEAIKKGKTCTVRPATSHEIYLIKQSYKQSAF